MLMQGVRLKQVDCDYRVHQQAFLNFAVKAEKKAGKNKTKPVYSTFEKFFDYDKAIRQAKGESKKESKFAGLSRFLKEREEKCQKATQ